MKRKILIVDDDESIRVSLKYLLKGKYTPITVSSGEEALIKLKHNKFDAILLDIKMDGIDGLETLKVIREEYNNKIVIIMLSVFDDEDNKKSALKFGANDYLVKPYKKDELLFSLERFL